MKKLIIPTIISIGIFLLLSPMFETLTSNLHPVVLIVLFCCIFAFILCIYLFLRKEHITVSTKLIWIVSFLYTISLVTLLFFRPNVQNEDAINLVPFSTLSIYLSGDVYWLIAFYNLAANVALFIPFGILLKWKTNNYLLLLLVPLLAISTIELSQYLTQRGSLDIDDLILNTIGFLIGYALTPMFQHIIHLKSVQS